MSRTDADTLNATMLTGLEEGDAKLIASVYGPDARLLAPGLEAQTGDEITGYWQGAIDAGLRHGRIETVSYEEHDGIAVEEGRWELRASAQAPVVDAGTFLVVHRLQADGSWKYAFDCFNSSLPAAPA